MYCIFVPKGSTEPVRDSADKDVGYVCQKIPMYLGGRMVVACYGQFGLKVLKLIQDKNSFPAGEGGLGVIEVGRVLKDAGFAKLLGNN